MDTCPEISVVVASHDRPLRLRWLLNALEEQTLDSARWEVVVGHDSRGLETRELLHTHSLARDGTLRHVALPPGSGPPGANRNAALALAHGDVIAFTDDDCRPPADWLEQALAASKRHPGAIVQGATRPDPEEAHALGRAPHRHSQQIEPPVPWAQACNIIYPRELIARVGGFAEDMLVGEDTDLAIRAREAGATYVAAPEIVTYHAIDEESLAGGLRRAWRWRDLPRLIKRHPGFRAELPLWIFWKRAHAWLPLAVAGIVLARRRAIFALLAVPWARHALPDYGWSPRGRARAVAELPLVAVVDAAEFATLAVGSVRQGTVVL